MGKMVGIDLGTTNSCVAFLENGEPIVIPNAEGGRTTPSVVAFLKDGQRVVGAGAKRQAVTNSQRTFFSVKRDMGTDNRVAIDGKQYTPQELSAMILQKLKADAEAYLGEPVTDAVITVPAYFSDSQRQATKDAGRIAGIHVQRIINEPTAAALAYGINKAKDQKIMVFDLGGGTFDVSVLDVQNDMIEVLATAGNNRLGGDDFDNCIASYLVDLFAKQEKIDLTGDAAAMNRIREASEKAKIELSSAMSTVISLPFLALGSDGAKHLETTLTREKFNQLTAHLVEATTGPVRQALKDADITPSQLSRVLLVGGSTRIPAVQQAVKMLTGKEPSRDINPDECVAMGACLQGGVLAGEVKGLVLLDVTPLSLGIETMGDVFSRIIQRNTSIPVQRSQVFTTAANYQSSVEIHVLQGEREIASCNKTLGRFRLNGIRRALRGVPQIEVTFTIDLNGIVNVSARDLDTGKHQEITLTHSSNMSDAEIQRAINEAQRYATEDARRKEFLDLQNQAEQLYLDSKSVQKNLSHHDKERLEGLRKELKRAMERNDGESIRRAMTNLNAAMESMGRFVNNTARDDRDGAMDVDYSESGNP